VDLVNIADSVVKSR